VKIINSTLIIIIGCVISAVVGFFVRKSIAESKIGSAEETAIRIVQEAEKTGEAKKKEALLEAKEEIHRLRSEMEKENKERRAELTKSERRIIQKRKMWTERWSPTRRRKKKLVEQSNKLREAQDSIDELYAKKLVELERVSGLTSEDAKKELLENCEERCSTRYCQAD